MSVCCPPGSIGIKLGVEEGTETTVEHLVVPKALGSYVTHDGLDMYVSGKPSSSAVIVLPEVFGIASGRLKNIADQLAAHGWYAILPKVQPNPNAGEGWEGDGFGTPFNELSFENLLTWLATDLPWPTVKPRLEKVIDYAKSTGATKIGAIGFCWGSWAIFKASAEWPGAFTCGVHCHPSVRLEEALFKESQNDLAERVSCPMAMFAAGNDPDNCKPGGDFQNIFNKKEWGKDCVFVDFPDMEHGWVSRGDTNVENVKRDVEKALSLSFEFFKKLL